MIPRTGAAPSPKRRGTSSPPRKVVAALRFHQRCCKDAARPARPHRLRWDRDGLSPGEGSGRGLGGLRFPAGPKTASFEKSRHPVELIGQVEQFLSDLRNVGLTR